MNAYRRICCQYFVMEVFFFSVKDFEKEYLEKANNNRFKLGFTAEPLSPQTILVRFGVTVFLIALFFAVFVLPWVAR